MDPWNAQTKQKDVTVTHAVDLQRIQLRMTILHRRKTITQDSYACSGFKTIIFRVQKSTAIEIVNYGMIELLSFLSSSGDQQYIMR